MLGLEEVSKYIIYRYKTRMKTDKKNRGDNYNEEFFRKFFN